MGRVKGVSQLEYTLKKKDHELWKWVQNKKEEMKEKYKFVLRKREVVQFGFAKTQYGLDVPKSTVWEECPDLCLVYTHIYHEDFSKFSGKSIFVKYH